MSIPELGNLELIDLLMHLTIEARIIARALTKGIWIEDHPGCRIKFRFQCAP